MELMLQFESKIPHRLIVVFPLARRILLNLLLFQPVIAALLVARFSGSAPLGLLCPNGSASSYYQQM